MIMAIAVKFNRHTGSSSAYLVSIKPSYSRPSSYLQTSGRAGFVSAGLELAICRPPTVRGNLECKISISGTI